MLFDKLIYRLYIMRQENGFDKRYLFELKYYKGTLVTTLKTKHNKIEVIKKKKKIKHKRKTTTVVKLSDQKMKNKSFKKGDRLQQYECHCQMPDPGT